ncbi:MAG: oligosaccharide flippase family protein [Pseudomonadota bacterium]
MKQEWLFQAQSLAARASGDKLTQNIGWLTGAEMVSRLGRIAAAVILARQLDAVAFGVAAMAITVFEIIRVFTENGIGAAVIRADRDQFDKVANTAHKMMWRICMGLAAVQILAGLCLEFVLPGQDSGAMVAALALVFFIMPFGLLHAYSLQREQRMKHLAAVTSAQAVADHTLTALLALLGFGAWAIILPKILTTPIWLFGVRHTRPWKRRPEAGFARSGVIFRFSLPVLGAELLTTARDQLDKLVVSLFLGIEALGLYYFAFNAGLGVSTALNRAFSNAVYPNLCNASDKLKAFKAAVSGLGLPLGLVYCAQAAAALLYVPIVFGERWSQAAPLVALLCLGGPARLLVDGARMYARAEGRSGNEFLLAVGFCTSILIPFTVATPFGLMHAAIASVVGASLYAYISTIAAFRPSILPNAATMEVAR